MKAFGLPRRMRALAGAVMAAMIGAFIVFSPSWAAEAPASDVVMMKLAPPPSEEALAKIPDPGRKLLALRSYLRAGAKIAERWSWTDAEIKAFQGSPAQQALLADIAAVNAHFTAANPGYVLYVHATVRSLDEQIAKWNANESVGVAGKELLDAYMAAFGAEGAAPADPGKIAAWLRGFKPSKRANLAAPGMTLHGRANAIDFQVMKDGQIYAGANVKQVESVWRAEGWDKKLKASMDAAGPAFKGPLTDPDEPWHYDYTPRAAETAAQE